VRLVLLIAARVSGQWSGSGFRDFDRALAERLGIAISSGDQTVANTLSQNWFDDGYGRRG